MPMLSMCVQVNVTMPAFYFDSDRYIHGTVMANYTSGAPVLGNLTLKATFRPIRLNAPYTSTTGSGTINESAGSRTSSSSSSSSSSSRANVATIERNLTFVIIHFKSNSDLTCSV